MKRLLSDIADLSISQDERAAMYADYDGEASSFREDLLKHLAARIVVKEHKLRYQKE